VGQLRLLYLGCQASKRNNRVPKTERSWRMLLKEGCTKFIWATLGIERGQSQAVKGFAQRLINDHNMANQELATLAKQKGVLLLGDDAKMISMPLATKSGADFDKEFARAMIEDHQKDISAFEKEASSGNDPDVKNWASKTLPTLRAHLAEAQALALPEQRLP
jgi:putative membrane protein